MAKKERPGDPGSGGLVNPPKRTEMVSVRLAPRLRYAAEIAARWQRRTLSSLVESAVAAHLQTLEVTDDGRETKLMKLMDALWDADESDRFVLLAQNQRHLLNLEEEFRWKAILDHFKTRGTTLSIEERKALRPIYADIKERVRKERHDELLNFAGR